MPGLHAQLWDDIKKTLCHLADERGTSVVLVIDEAQHLSDRFLADLSGFLNFAFDSRDLLTLWLVGLPSLDRTLRMQQHTPLWMRITERVHREPLERDSFLACIDHGLKAAGSSQRLLADSSLELLFRASRGILRLSARIRRLALDLAHDHDQSFVDHVLSPPEGQTRHPHPRHRIDQTHAPMKEEAHLPRSLADSAILAGLPQVGET